MLCFRSPFMRHTPWIPILVLAFAACTASEMGGGGGSPVGTGGGTTGAGAGSTTGAGAGTTVTCTETLSCYNNLSLTLTGLVAKVGSDLPATTKVCAGTACTTFVLEAGDGGVPTCGPVYDTGCDVESGNEVAVAHDLLAGTTAGMSVPVHVTVTDMMDATLFDATQTIVTTFVAGAPCQPSCSVGQVTFTVE